MRIWVGFQGGDKECSKEHRRHETQVSSLGWEDLMEKRMATHSSILSWESPWKSSLGATAYWVARVGDDLETKPPWLIHIVLSLKPKQHCKAIILQFEKNKQAKKELPLQNKSKNTN